MRSRAAAPSPPVPASDLSERARLSPSSPAYRIVQPASTVNSRPVTYRASSEARNSTALLTSRGSMGSTASVFM